jgi:hypothetical protein
MNEIKRLSKECLYVANVITTALPEEIYAID